MFLHKKRNLYVVTLLLAIVATSHVVLSREQTISTREEILASNERRVKQIENLLEDSQQRYIDHKNGIRILNEKELQNLERKIDIYTKKLDSMRSIDEREVQRIIQREKIIQERHKERQQKRLHVEL